MSAAGLIPRNWYVLKNTEEELVLVSKGAGKTRRIKKEQNWRKKHECNGTCRTNKGLERK